MFAFNAHQKLALSYQGETRYLIKDVRMCRRRPCTSEITLPLQCTAPSLLATPRCEPPIWQLSACLVFVHIIASENENPLEEERPSPCCLGVLWVCRCAHQCNPLLGSLQQTTSQSTQLVPKWEFDGFICVQLKPYALQRQQLLP